LQFFDFLPSIEMTCFRGAFPERSDWDVFNCGMTYHAHDATYK